MLRLRLVRNFTSKAGRISSKGTTKVFRNEPKPVDLKKSAGDEAAISTAEDSAPPLLQYLKDRNLVANVTDESLGNKLQEKFMSFYLGIDPSGPSMHLGHMVPVMIMLHLYLRGHYAFALVGGATGAVGDPSGKKKERDVVVKDTLASNLDSLASSLERTFLHAIAAAKEEGVFYADQMKLQYAIVNNHDWWKNVGFLEFLGAYGRLIRINQMINRDSVKDRITSPVGLGYNEFSYQILQAFDFWHLFETQGCTLQLGGGDQWGNITAGVDLTKKAAHINNIKETPYGLTTQLILSKSGQKLGKSEKNATIWLNPKMTRPFELYQYLLQTQDVDVEQYLKMFTFVSLEKIAEIMEKQAENPSLRYAQRILADKVTALIHGDSVIERCQVITRVMFARTNLELNQQPKPEALTDPKKFKSILAEEGLLKSLDPNIGYVDLVAKHFDKSKSAAKKLIANKAVSVGLDTVKKVKVSGIEDEHRDLEDFLIVRVGKVFQAFYLGIEPITETPADVGIRDLSCYEVDTEAIDVTRPGRS